jgi:hypothetical protein
MKVESEKLLKNRLQLGVVLAMISPSSHFPPSLPSGHDAAIRDELS